MGRAYSINLRSSGRYVTSSKIFRPEALYSIYYHLMAICTGKRLNIRSV